MSYLGCSVRLYLQLFVAGLMSYLHYLCLFVYSGVKHILCCVVVLFVFILCTLCCQFLCVIVLFVFILCTLCCQFLWIVQFWLPLRYSLTFIKMDKNINARKFRSVDAQIFYFKSTYATTGCNRVLALSVGLFLSFVGSNQSL